MPKGPRRPSRGARVAEKSPPAYTQEVGIARVFQSGNSQAVRLPKQFRLRSKQVQVFRRGDDLVLREQPVKLRELLAALPPLSDDALPDDFPDQLPEAIEIES